MLMSETVVLSTVQHKVRPMCSSNGFGCRRKPPTFYVHYYFFVCLFVCLFVSFSILDPSYPDQQTQLHPTSQLHATSSCLIFPALSLQIKKSRCSEHCFFTVSVWGLGTFYSNVTSLLGFSLLPRLVTWLSKSGSQNRTINLNGEVVRHKNGRCCVRKT